MTKLKRILAVPALLCMAVFIVTTVIYILGGAQELTKWMYGSMAGFLFLGVLTLVIDYFHKRMQENQAAEKADQGGDHA